MYENSNNSIEKLNKIVFLTKIKKTSTISKCLVQTILKILIKFCRKLISQMLIIFLLNKIIKNLQCGHIYKNETNN